MASKVFLDANFLLDFTLQRTGYDSAKEIISLGVQGEIDLFTTPSVLHITGYWLTKSYTNKKARTLILTLLNDLRIIDCDHETTLLAMNSAMEDMEDALQYYTALTHGLDYFISSDKKLKKAAIPQLPVFAPKEFLDHFRIQ
jgi:predicted nucleic acid-binding protein